MEEIRNKALEDLKNCVIDPTLVEELKRATKEERDIEPVTVNPNGIVISGANRLSAHPNWTMKVHNCDDKAALLLRYKLEQQTKSLAFKTESLRQTVKRLANFYLKTEVGKKELKAWKKLHEHEWTYKRTRESQALNKIAEDLGKSERHIRELFPQGLKMTSKTRKSMGIAEVEFRKVHAFLEELEKERKEDNAREIQGIYMEKERYARIERLARKWKVKPRDVINIIFHSETTIDYLKEELQKHGASGDELQKIEELRKHTFEAFQPKEPEVKPLQPASNEKCEHPADHRIFETNGKMICGKCLQEV